ncbi:uncharacterized protein LOC112487199 isoform X2 [Cynoglossus semilaevis]|uniref:uncharacterized protein LOC112487199 isoform X2 n=1 Tax=Cynoglossus semilaevis TaxID=244447 RepID=UPI000D62335C|nr:uncharacterized protein LOC112487199 isoform X2 [Cynoglossus semilaevis]
MKMSLNWFFFLLQFTGVHGKHLHLVVRVGEEVTLPCDRRLHRHPGDSLWLFRAEPRAQAAVLVSRGVTGGHSGSGLNFTQEFSLVIQQVAVKDAGQYTCKFSDTSGHNQSIPVYLSVISISADTETLMCCVYSYHHHCGHTVEWLKGGAEVGGQTAQTSCSSTLTFQTPLTAQDRSSFTCRVGDSGSSDFLLCDVASGSCVKTAPSHWRMYVLVAVAVIAVLAVCVGLRRFRGARTQTDDSAVEMMIKTDDNDEVDNVSH